MIKQSVYSSVLAAKLASNFLSEGGLLSLTGAKAALDGGNPGKAKFYLNLKINESILF
jgi:dihydropteridine reductase